jgi:hypothetical protein
MMSNVDKLVIYNKSSELHNGKKVEVFKEGKMSPSAQQRYQNISQSLSNGFLKKEIEKCLNHPEQLNEISLLQENHKKVIEAIVSAVTGDVGRAVVGLSVLQCTVKAIECQQSIRLHKGGRGAKNDFSWEEGISMRSLDNTFITPVLREFNLVKLNKDGLMMTRTLAENYPYSNFYKAQIRGAKEKWLELVNFLEESSNSDFAKGCLQYLISKLINTAQNFQKLANESESYINQINEIDITFEEVSSLMLKHWSVTNYASRTMEVSMHSFIQAFQDLNFLDNDRLLPLSQMRSANKKHKNIGDIEITLNRKIVESWDAKYGKSYFYDELEELADKLELHNDVKVAGFVSSSTPDKRPDIIEKMQSLSEQFDLDIQILSFNEWLDYKISEFNLTEEEINLLGEMWLIAYTECLSLKRLDRAPIDEPCHAWLESWHDLLKIKLENFKVL